MGLVAHWKLDGNAKDSLGEYNGFEVGGPTYSSGKIGDCYDNTGNNAEGIELIRDDDFGEYEDLYSFSMFFKSTTTSGNGGARLISRDASEYPTIIIRQNDSSPQELYFYEATNDSGNVVNVNEWHHLAFTIDTGNNSSQLFIDGELIDSGGVNNDTSARPYVIGGNTEGDGDVSGNNFIGKIDDVRLYDHILSQKEVKQLSQAKVLHYKFDRKSTSIVGDASGYGNTGEIRGASHTTESKVGQGAYEFTDSNGVLAENNSTLQVTTDLTISFWAKPFDIDSPSRQNPIHKDYTHEYTMTMETSGDLSFYFNDSDSSYNNYQADNMFQNDGEWVHVTAVRKNGDGVYWYRNGELFQTEGWNGGDPIAGGNDVQIGDGYTNPFNGILDDFRIHATALSDDEVKDIYEQRASIDSGGNLHTLQLTESEDRFDEFVGSVREDTDVLGSQDGFDEVYRLDARENGSYEDFLTGRVRTGDWNNSGPGNNLYLVLWLKGNKFPDGGFRGTFIKKPAPDTNEYQQYILRADGDNSRNEYFRLFYSNNDDTSFSFIGDPKIFTESEFEKRTQISSTGETLFDSFSEIGPAPASLVGWWPLDGDTNEYSGKSGDASVAVGSPSITSGFGQSAYSFNESGSGEQLDANLNRPTNTEITASAWIYPNNSTDTRAPIFRADRFYFQHYSNDRIATYWYGSQDNGYHYSNSGSVPTNKWSHVVTTWDNSGSIDFYVDGNKINTVTGVGGGPRDELDSVRIGRENDGRRYNGKIQDVRIYDRALNEKEVKILYNMTNPEQKQQVIVDEDSTIITKNQFSEII